MIPLEYRATARKNDIFSLALEQTFQYDGVKFSFVTPSK